jgi:hypothetical protein
MAGQWKVVGIEKFKGQDYIKMERQDKSDNPFAKTHANFSREQVKALLEGMLVPELAEFAGLDPEKFI